MKLVDLYPYLIMICVVMGFASLSWGSWMLVKRFMWFRSNGVGESYTWSEIWGCLLISATLLGLGLVPNTAGNCIFLGPEALKSLNNKS